MRTKMHVGKVDGLVEGALKPQWRAGLAIVSLLLVSSPAFAQSNATCHSADNVSARVLSMAKSLMDPARSALRTKLQLPLVAAEQVTLATDSALCFRAGQALDSIGRVLTPGQPDPPASKNPLYVLQIGNSFAVLDPNVPIPQHYYYVFYFGPSWEFRRVATF